MAGASDPKAIAANFLATFSTGNVPAVLEAMTADGSWFVAGTLEGMKGRFDRQKLGPLLEGAQSLYRPGGGLVITPVSMVAEGNRVAIEATGLAHLANGKTYHPSYHFLIEVRDGKVHEVREYMDTLHAKATFFDG